MNLILNSETFKEDKSVIRSRSNLMEIKSLADSISGDPVLIARYMIHMGDELKYIDFSTFNKPHGDVNKVCRLGK